MDYAGIQTDHIAIRTSPYTGTRSAVAVEGLDYLVERLKANDRVLIADDVFDSGRSVEQVVRDLDVNTVLATLESALQECGALSGPTPEPTEFAQLLVSTFVHFPSPERETD